MYFEVGFYSDVLFLQMSEKYFQFRTNEMGNYFNIYLLKQVWLFRLIDIDLKKRTYHK